MDQTTINAVVKRASDAWEACKRFKADNYDQTTHEWKDAASKASYDTSLNDALDLKRKADAALAQRKIELEVEGIEATAAQSAGQLPGMGASRKSADEGGPDGALRVRYKATPYDQDIKTRDITGTEDFPAVDEVAYTEVFRTYLGRPDAWQRAEKSAFDLARRKALSVGLDAAGGALVASEVFVAALIQSLRDVVIMRQLGDVRPPLTMATSMAAPSATNMNDATWTAEIQPLTMDTAAPFGKRRLTPHQLAKGFKISEPLLRLSSIDVEAWARQQTVDCFAAPEESAFMTGDGAGKPEGVFTSALTTIVTAASATVIDWLDLHNVVVALKSQYRAGASWIMHRTIFGEINGLVDGVGRPLFREMPGAGMSFILMGFPVNESEYAPGSSATGLDVAMLGNYKRGYWIQDSLALTIKRLNELYSETNEIGYHARKETDGMVVDGNGINKLRMA